MQFVFQERNCSSGGLPTASVVLDRGTQVGESKGLCSPLLPDESLFCESFSALLKQLKLERNCERLALT